MIKLLIWSRKIHRLFVFVTSALIFVMATTGLLLKYTSFASIIFLNLGLIRFLHNNLSPYLTIALMVMVMTGLIMYIGPKLISR